MAALTQAISSISRPAVQAGRRQSALPKVSAITPLTVRSNKVRRPGSAIQHVLFELDRKRRRCTQVTRAARNLQVRAARSTDEGVDVEQIIKDLQDRVSTRSEADLSQKCLDCVLSCVISAVGPCGEQDSGCSIRSRSSCTAVVQLNNRISCKLCTTGAHQVELSVLQAGWICSPSAAMQPLPVFYCVPFAGAKAS